MKHFKQWFCALLAAVLIVASGNLSVPAEIQSSVTVQEEQVRSFVERLYTILLGREAEEAGLVYWSDILSRKQDTGANVAANMVFSEEIQNSNLSNEEYITRLYQTVFDREPEKDGLDYWMEVLEQGALRTHVGRDILNSSEFADVCAGYGIIAGKVNEPGLVPDTGGTTGGSTAAAQEEMVKNFVKRLYSILLDREVEEEGLDYWSGVLIRKEDTGAKVAANIVLSEELDQRKLDNEQFITALYQTVFDREPEEGGKNYWLDILKTGEPRENVSREFLNSPEFGRVCEKYNIIQGSLVLNIEAEGFLIRKTTNGVVICGVTDKTLRQINIPESIGGNMVVGIWDTAFADCSRLETLVLPATLETLSAAVLETAPALKTVECAVGMSKTVQRVASRFNHKEIWAVIDTDTARYGMWNLTYREFVELYDSIGTENDLFLAALKERGPAHTEEHIFYEYDGISNLEITFDDVLAEKMYALHYAPFNYSGADFENGEYGKNLEEAYLDHGGVCSILTMVYHHFIQEILGETEWKYCEYGNVEVNHAVLLIQVEDGRILQVDNGSVDSWWLGLDFVPDGNRLDETCDFSDGYTNIGKHMEEAFAKWEQEFATLEKSYWHTFGIIYSVSDDETMWKRRPIWYNYETAQYETYFCEDTPCYYTVTFRGLPGKVVSMAGYMNLDGYITLDELNFE